jgi:uncharacterized protein YjdB
MEGGEGSDIYVYEVNGGHDVISNISNNDNDQDELHFGPGITSADLSFKREDEDLLIDIGDGEGSVTVEGWYLAEKNKLAKIVFDDGTELTTEEIEALVEAEDVFIHVTSVTVAPVSADLTSGGKLQLTPTVLPADATSKDVTWTTSNGAVGVVNATGEVTGGAVGTATITATTVDGNYTANCVITVKSAIVAVTGVQVSPTALSLSTGGTGSLTATVEPANATNKAVTWSTSNASVAAVDSTGTVTAVAPGTATISVTTSDENHTAESVVTVTSTVVAVIGIQVSPATLSLEEEATESLTATVTPENATNKAVTWSTSNDSVATVDSTGTVTAVAPGTATITGTTEDGNKTANCVVTCFCPAMLGANCSVWQSVSRQNCSL